MMAQKFKNRQHRHNREKNNHDIGGQRNESAWVTSEFVEKLIEALSDKLMAKGPVSPLCNSIAAFHDNSVHVGPIGSSEAKDPHLAEQPSNDGVALNGTLKAIQDLQQLVSGYEKILKHKEERIKTLEKDLDLFMPGFFVE
ncbi:MAG: hypothetical protein ACK4E0_14680 [Chitinophagaceae bacterium]